MAKTEIGSNDSHLTSSDDDDGEGIMTKYITLIVILFQEQSVQLFIMIF